MSRTVAVLLADMITYRNLEPLLQAVECQRTLRGSPSPADLSSIEPPLKSGLKKSTSAARQAIGLAKTAGKKNDKKKDNIIESERGTEQGEKGALEHREIVSGKAFINTSIP